MERKGYVLSWDALIALTVVLIALAGFMTLPYFRSLREGEVAFQQIHLRTEDAMEAVSKEGDLVDMSTEWAADEYTNESEFEGGQQLSGASVTAKNSFDPIVPPTAGYKVIVGGEVVYSSEWDQPSRPREDASREETRAVRYVSGFGPGSDQQGWVARADLTGNLTRSATKLRWPLDGGNLTAVSFNLSRGNRDEAPYLIVPRNARLLNGSLNLTWRTLANETNCPIL